MGFPDMEVGAERFVHKGFDVFAEGGLIPKFFKQDFSDDERNAGPVGRQTLLGRRP